MYNLLNGTISQNFTDYPSDMLLYFKWVSFNGFKGATGLKKYTFTYWFAVFVSIYYRTKDIKPANCRSYYSAMGAADFSVASSVLNKGSLLLSEAKSCLVSAIETMIHYKKWE